MRFQVPQFIDVEDKIFGPLTLKQFIYIAGGGGLSFLVYILLGSIFWSAIPIIVIMAISSAFAFYRINNKSFVNMVEYAFKYYFGNKLFLWKKKENARPEPSTRDTSEEMRNYASIMVPKISDSKLKDLTWSLDIKESMYSNKKQK